MGETYKLEEKLYKTVDGEVVRAGTGRAATLYRRKGARIPIEEARALGLVDAPKKPEPKQASKPADKRRSAAKNKKRG